MDCPDCGCPMAVLSQTIQGDDSFHIIETEWYCPVCDIRPENETGKDER